MRAIAKRALLPSDECPLLDLDDHALHKLATISGCSVLRSCKRIYDVTTATDRVLMALSENNIDINDKLMWPMILPSKLRMDQNIFLGS